MLIEQFYIRKKRHIKRVSTLYTFAEISLKPSRELHEVDGISIMVLFE